MEVAAGASRVAGFADNADVLPLPHPFPTPNRRRPRQVRVEVAAPLAFTVDQQVVPVKDRVEAPPQDPAVAYRDQPCSAGRGDVETFVDAAAVARCVVGADRPALSVRRLDGIDVAVVGGTAIAAADRGGSWCGQGREQSEDERRGVLQWCSMTRSTMLYSFASSALMK